MKFPEKHRQPMRGSLYESASGDPCGIFLIPHGGDLLFCLATDGEALDSPADQRWEHVSVTVRNKRSLPLRRCATWEQMCFVKGHFWNAAECVVQFHPPKAEHVNNHAFCLHLWKPSGEEIKTPPSILVGIKGLELTQ